MSEQISAPQTGPISTIEVEPPRVNAAKSSAVMAAGTLLSRVLGFVKGALVAVALGAVQNGMSDIFEAANTLPNLIYIMLAGGVFNTVLVPQIIKASKQPDRGADFLSRLLTLGGLALAVITIAATLLSSPLISGLTQNWSQQQLQIGTQLAYLLIPQIFFYGIYALLGQILNANDRFGAYMWAPVLNNVVAIAGLVVFIAVRGTAKQNPLNVDNWGSAQTWILGGSATLGIVLQALILIGPVKRLKLGLRIKWGWRGMGLGHTGKIAGWALATMIIGQLSFIVVTKIASAATGVKTGPDSQEIAGLFVFNNGMNIYLLPHSVIVLSIATVFFNQLSRSATTGNREAVRITTSKLLRTVGVATVFLAMVLFVLSAPIGMLLGGGTAQGGSSVGIAVAVLALSSPFFSFNFMLNRVFYAMEDAKTPFYIQAFIVLLTVITALIVSAVPVSVLSYSLLGTVAIVNFVAPVVSTMVLRVKLGDFGIWRIIRAHVQYAVAAAFSGIIGGLFMVGFGLLSFADGSYDGFIWQGYFPAIVVIAVVGSVMALCYLLALRLINVRELNDLIAPIMRRFSRRAS